MPTAVARAQLLAFGLVGVYVVQTLVAFVASDALVDHWAKAHNYTGEFASMADSAAPAYGFVALISLVVFGGLLAFVQDPPVWYGAIVVVGGLLGLGVTVMLFTGDSSRWFSGRAEAAAAQ